LWVQMVRRHIPNAELFREDVAASVGLSSLLLRRCSEDRISEHMDERIEGPLVFSKYRASKSHDPPLWIKVKFAFTARTSALSQEPAYTSGLAVCA
jgi:hypothetical protein